jgi:propionyl-CoA synthetase
MARRVPMPGWDIQVLDDAGHEVPRARSAMWWQAAAAARVPADAVERRRALPPGLSRRVPRLLQDRRRRLIDEDGYLFIMARTDDIINVAGHRLSTGAMEEVLAEHPDVAECAVIGIADAMKGQIAARLRGAERRYARFGRSRKKSSRWCATRSGRWRRSRR